jgi:hypothetical protein
MPQHACRNFTRLTDYVQQFGGQAGVRLIRGNLVNLKFILRCGTLPASGIKNPSSSDGFLGFLFNQNAQHSF